MCWSLNFMNQLPSKYCLAPCNFTAIYFTKNESFGFPMTGKSCGQALRGRSCILWHSHGTHVWQGEVGGCLCLKSIGLFQCLIDHVKGHVIHHFVPTNYRRSIGPHAVVFAPGTCDLFFCGWLLLFWPKHFTGNGGISNNQIES
jgi:hypothetical protein